MVGIYMVYILVHICKYSCEFVSRTARDPSLPVVLTHKSNISQWLQHIDCQHLSFRGLISMYYFLLPIPDFPPVGVCKKMQILELTLSPLKVERYTTVTAHVGNALSKTKQNPKQNKTTPTLHQTQAAPCCVTHMLGTESKLWQTEAMAVSLCLTNLSHWLSRGISSFKNRERKWNKYQKERKTKPHMNIYNLYCKRHFPFRNLTLKKMHFCLNKDPNYTEIHWWFWADLFNICVTCGLV